MNFENPTPPSDSEAAKRMRQLGLEIQEAIAAGDTEKAAQLESELRVVGENAVDPLTTDAWIAMVEKKSKERARDQQPAAANEPQEPVAEVHLKADEWIDEMVQKGHLNPTTGHLNERQEEDDEQPQAA